MNHDTSSIPSKSRTSPRRFDKHGQRKDKGFYNTYGKLIDVQMVVLTEKRPTVNQLYERAKELQLDINRHSIMVQFLYSMYPLREEGIEFIDHYYAVKGVADDSLEQVQRSKKWIDEKWSEVSR